MSKYLSENFNKMCLVLAGSVVAGLFFNYSFFDKFPGLSIPIYMLFLLASVLLLYAKFRGRPDVRTLLLALGSQLFATFMFVRSSPALMFLDFVAAMYLLILLLDGLNGGRLSRYLWLNYFLTAIVVPWQMFRRALRYLLDLSSLRGLVKEQKNLTQIARGIILAIPILLLLVVLLSSADLVFSRYLSNIITFNLPEKILGQTVLFLIIAFAYSGFANFAIHGRLNEETATKLEAPDHLPHLGKIEFSIILGSIAALFLIFILVQVKYLFGGQEHIIALGFTYADYARKGFFELIAVGGFIFLLLLAMDKYAFRNDNLHYRSFRWLGAVLTAEVMVIMASAFMRLNLYEQAYGFTDSRFYAHAVILFLAVVFLLLLYKILKHRSESFLAVRVFGTIIVALIILNAINPDAFIARKNIERFTETGKIDTVYLGSLSWDAIPETLKVLDAPGVDSTELISKLQSDLKTNERNSGWQSVHWAKINARRSLDKYKIPLD